MSVDISQMTAQLDPERREAVKTQYNERALNSTAAFLLCFFLGSAGAHRFYLKEWRVGFAHLALFALGAVSLVAGLYQTLPLTTELASHPVGFALDVAGVLLLLIALIWEIIDLGRIDHQVYRRNLLLAEGIIAGTLLADQTVVEGARQRLDDVMRQTHTQAQPTAAGAAAGIITANEVADARALAEESGGMSSISYTEVSRFDVSANPDPASQASADAVHEGNWAEITTTAETAPDAAPTTFTETATRTHTEDGPHVTDTYEVDHVASPAAEVAGLGAVGLGAAALGAGLAEAAPASGFDESTQPDYATLAAPAAEAAPASGFDEPTQPDYAAFAAPVAEAAPAEPFAAAQPAGASDYAMGQADAYNFDDDDIGDVTDASMPAVVAPAADIAFAHSTPAFVRLPDEVAAQEEPSAPLYITPEEPPTDAAFSAPEPVSPMYEAPVYETPAYEAPASVEPSAESFVPPVASVFSAPAEAPTAPTPSWDQPTSVQAEPAPEPARHDTVAEAAGVARLAGAGALAAEAFADSHAAEPAPEPVVAEPVAAEPVAAPEPPKLRKIRVKRAAVLDGKVVGEMVVEGEVLPGETPQEAANRIQAEMGHYTPEQIARAANLSADEEVELHQRTEESGAEQ